jgi:hypothetical protein
MRSGSASSGWFGEMSAVVIGSVRQNEEFVQQPPMPCKLRFRDLNGDKNVSVRL